MTDSYIYFVRPVGADGPVKIGVSRIPTDRLMQLAFWSPIPLEIAVTIPGDFALEQNLHECFFDSHSHLEWFHASPRLTAAIADLQRGVPVEKAVDLSTTYGVARSKLPRPSRSAGQRSYMSVILRIRNAMIRGSAIAGAELGYPEDAFSIAFAVGDRPDGMLTEAEAARVQEICDDPVSHCPRVSA